MQKILQRTRLTGSGNLRVFSVTAESAPAYLLTLSSEAADVLATALAPVLDGRKLPSHTEWVLFQEEAAAILAAALEPT